MLGKLFEKTKQIPTHDFIISEDDNLIKIVLKDGEYKGVIFTYGKVKIDEKDDECHLSFEYDVLESPFGDLTKDENFKNTLGDLLVSMITTNLNNRGIDEIRTDDSEEPDFQ